MKKERQHELAKAVIKCELTKKIPNIIFNDENLEKEVDKKARELNKIASGIHFPWEND